MNEWKDINEKRRLWATLKYVTRKGMKNSTRAWQQDEKLRAQHILKHIVITHVSLLHDHLSYPGYIQIGVARKRMLHIAIAIAIHDSSEKFINGKNKTVNSREEYSLINMARTFRLTLENWTRSRKNGKSSQQ